MVTVEIKITKGDGNWCGIKQEGQTAISGYVLCQFLAPKNNNVDKEILKETIGFIENYTYQNNYFGFTIKFPHDWTIIQDQETIQYIKNMASNLVFREDKHFQNILKVAELQTLVLFTSSKYPLGTRDTSNPNIVCLTEIVSDIPDIKKGKDYHFHTKKHFEATKTEVSFPQEIYTETLGGIDFDVMTVQMSVKGVIVELKQYVAIIKDYALVFTVAFSNDEHEAELADILNTIKFN